MSLPSKEELGKFNVGCYRQQVQKEIKDFCEIVCFLYVPLLALVRIAKILANLGVRQLNLGKIYLFT